ncbi:hypothetical protein Droror1_Dr00009943 [Drosera rotundifolia]
MEVELILSKWALKTTKARMEGINRKRNSMQKFLKKDIANLLKDHYDRNAYLRAEGLYIEMNMSSCYDCVNDYCRCILKNVKEMHKERECTKECRVAVASLIYAAARFADLPELRELRNLFRQKYGDVIESYVSEEFKLKLKGNPPSRETKIQLLKDIAQEFSIAWDPKSLEQPQPSLAVPEQDIQRDLESSSYIDKHMIGENETPDHQAEGNVVDGDTSSTTKHNSSSKTGESDKEFGELKIKEQRGSESDSLKSDIKEKPEQRRPFADRNTTTPYTIAAKVVTDNADGANQAAQSKAQPSKVIKGQERETDRVDSYHKRSSEEKDENNGVTCESKPKPRSVRSRFPRKQTEVADSDHTKIDQSSGETSQQSPKQQQSSSLGNHDQDEKIVDDLLFHYSLKKLARASTQGANVHKQHMDEEKDQVESELPLPPYRRRYFSPDLDSEPSTPKSKPRHVRAASFHPDHGIVHVHPRLPEYDELAERLEAFRKLNL